MQSGTALCSWAIREDHRYIAGQIGSFLDCPGTTENPNSADLVDCLKKIPVDQLSAALLKLVGFEHGKVVLFCYLIPILFSH